MAATYTKISDGEMHQFLSGLGFEQIYLPGVYEKVYAKRVDSYGLQLSLRVYTSIVQGAGSRKSGADAIRCEVVWRCIPETSDNEDEVPYLFVVGRSVRVHRIQTWRDNLLKRINGWEEMLGPPCPACGAPMLVRENKQDGSEFYGCSTYKEGWCKVTRPITYNPSVKGTR